MSGSVLYTAGRSFDRQVVINVSSVWFKQVRQRPDASASSPTMSHVSFHVVALPTSTWSPARHATAKPRKISSYLR